MRTGEYKHSDAPTVKEVDIAGDWFPTSGDLGQDHGRVYCKVGWEEIQTRRPTHYKTGREVKPRGKGPKGGDNGTGRSTSRGGGGGESNTSRPWAKPHPPARGREGYIGSRTGPSTLRAPGSPVCSAAAVLAAPGGGGSMRGPTAPQARAPRRRWRQRLRRQHLEAAPAFPHCSRGPMKEEPNVPLLADWPKHRGSTARLPGLGRRALLHRAML